MPSRLSNASLVFQALVNDDLHDSLNRFLFVYLNYILIFFRNLWAPVPRFVRFVKREKCEFHVNSVSFLGSIITEGQTKADPVKLQYRQYRNNSVFYASQRFITASSRALGMLLCLSPLSLSLRSPFCGVSSEGLVLSQRSVCLPFSFSQTDQNSSIGNWCFWLC